jgi:hypothetical protein
MKNIYLLIFILIFLYFICNRHIENFSVGCQSNEKTPINISGSLTLSYIDKCNPPPPPSCSERQKWYKNKCEYQCRCSKLSNCIPELETECNLANDAPECYSKSYRNGICTWYD